MGLDGLPSDFNIAEHQRFMENEDVLDDFYGGDSNRVNPAVFVKEQVDKLNRDQRAAFEKITAAILGRADRNLFFVEGAGGCGTLFFILPLKFYKNL